MTHDTLVKEPRYFNISECGNNILNKLGATFKRAYMATPREKCYTKMYETLVEYNDRNNAPFYNEKTRQAINIIIS